jgi:L-lactate dehydrogenase complex protein LldF
MKSTTNRFRQSSKAALENAKIQASLRGLYTGFNKARQQASEATEGWEAMQNQARVIKAHTLDNLDHYLEMVESNVKNNGGKVYFAKDASAAAKYVTELASAREVKVAIKGKSMVSEEMDLNTKLAEAGIESVETDLGEYIIQLAGQSPFHIIAPAIHMSKDDVADVFHKNLGTPRYDEASDLASEARARLRDVFAQADMGITGANFMIAETGSIVLITNEGNGRMCTSMPRIHVAIAGMEKVIPSLEDLSIFLRLLIRSATGQKISTYVTTIDGPRNQDEENGPDEFHLIVVDNGRSKLLADPELRESLYCIRCGACLNACPVYRKVGGHTYGWVYSGPIGAVITPVLTNVSDSKDLPYASSLCGACKEACPVKINIPRMLLHLRKELAEGTSHPSNNNVPLSERIAMKMWRLSVASSLMIRLSSQIVRFLQRPFVTNGRLHSLPPPLSGWTRYRTLRPLASKPFRTRFRSLSKDSHD